MIASAILIVSARLRACVAWSAVVDSFGLFGLSAATQACGTLFAIKGLTLQSRAHPDGTHQAVSGFRVQR